MPALAFGSVLSDMSRKIVELLMWELKRLFVFANRARLVAEAGFAFARAFQGEKSMNSQLEGLEGKLRVARLLLDDAEGRRFGEPSVKEWIDEVKDAIFRAEDLAEEIEAAARSRQEPDRSGSGMRALLRAVAPSSTEIDRTVWGEMAMICKDLDILLDRAAVLGLKHGDARSRRSLPRPPAPLQEGCCVRGRDDDRDQILRFLLADGVCGNQIGVLPILGVGGLGKTTLARMVWDDDLVKERGFEPKVWITVSTKVEICGIMKMILRQVGSKTTGETEERTVLQQEIVEALQRKKFLIVLDDVWNLNDENWDVLKSTFANGDSGSRVIVTTRSQQVGAAIERTGWPIHYLKRVSNEDSWNIFVDHAFSGDLVANSHLEKVGKRIVRNCKGLPLAIKCIGSLLRNERNSETWESILRSPIWKRSDSQSNNILPPLWLSYCYLPSCLKQCFAYCSIFPKDYKIKKENLILLWMAEGLLESDQKETRMEEVGGQYINDLISRSLFQRSNNNNSMFRMHDLVHDLAKFVSGDFCLRLDENKKLDNIAIKTRYLSQYGSSFRFLHGKALSKATHLRAFLDIGNSSPDSFVEEILAPGSCLRVLSPSTRSSISMLMGSFSNLKHLRYLDLSGSEVKEIPRSICTLYNLQTVLLSKCKRLTQLPTDLGNLINLRHLDTTGSPLRKMPPRMGNLKKLQTLTDFVLCEHDGSGIRELGALRHLGGQICIFGLQYVNKIEDVMEANLRSKENLSELTFHWQGHIHDTKRGMEILDALCPHTCLKKLTINGYPGSTFPSWVGDSLFSNIESVHISGNDYCCYLPPFGQLPFLRDLYIKSFHGVERIGDEFYGNGTDPTPFQYLEILSFYDMPAWNVWSLPGEDKESRCFPRLKQLHLYGCPNLNGSFPDCGTTETLEIGWCNKLEFPASHQHASVKKLKFEGFDSLKTLSLDHLPRLEKLVVEECQNLESLTFSEETCAHQSLRFLRLAVCKNFRSLPERMHRLLPSLAAIEISGCPNLESFPEGGLPSKLNDLVISSCCKLVANYGNWDLQGLTSLRSLHIHKCKAVLNSFPAGSLPISLTHLRLYGLPHLKGLNGHAFEHTVSLDSLSLINCNELQYLPEEVLRLSLRYLRIIDCPSLDRRYQRCRGEDWHKISHIPYLWISNRASGKKNDGP